MHQGQKKLAITGALSYSGRYIAEQALERGWQVISLEGKRSAHRPNPLDLPIVPFTWDRTDLMSSAMRGCDAFVNTYWIRSRAGKEQQLAQLAECHCRKLFICAQKAGIERIAHLSILHADECSALPYFRHKGRTEAILHNLGVVGSIVRPAMIFGESAKESTLANNWAWCLRRSPFAGLMGDGSARITPIHVKDLASMVCEELEATHSELRIRNAIGPESPTLKECTRDLLDAMGIKRPIIPLPYALARVGAQVLARLLGGKELFSAEEITALREGLLARPEEAARQAGRSFKQWLHEHGRALGKH